ncbi:MAG: Rrf2 family transcriptional regulator [Chloroflexota bacterium]
MKLSTRGRYAARALLELALRPGDNSATLKDIAQRQQISIRYLEHLITPLVAAGIVRSMRGPKGGIALARSPQEIKLSEVIQLLEGSTAPVECLDNPAGCARSATCVTRDVWGELRKAMDNVLGSTTIADLVERQKLKEQPQSMMYYL